MGEREYRRALGLYNRMRVHFIVDAGTVVWFAVQLESLFDGLWTPIVRYDTAHGFAHRDTMHPRRETHKEVLDFPNCNEAMTFAIADNQVHWQR